jgi:hypothetical protein
MKNLLYLLALIFMVSSCEEKMVVIPEFEAIETGKVVFVEELTGVRCPNCPAGSERLKSIQTLYPDNVVVVAIHGIDLAKPLDESRYDFRNDDAADLEIFLKEWLGKPSAYFNRVRFEELGEIWGNPANGQWQGYIERELEKEQVIDLSMTKSYNQETRELEITIGALPLVDLNGEFKVTIMLTESGIVDAQDDQNSIILDYVHNHVLMDVITNFDGDAFANALVKNQPVAKTYVYTIPDDGSGLWNVENLEIAAFVANTEGESEEILQGAYSLLLD